MSRGLGLTLLLAGGVLALEAPPEGRVSAYFQESSLDVDLTTRSDVREVWLWTNTGMRPGFEVRWRNYGLSIAPSLFGSIQDNPRQPPTRYRDFKLFYYGGAWGGEGYYQWYRGLHSDPPTGSGQILHAGMEIEALLLNAYYSPLHARDPQYSVRTLRDGLWERGYRLTPLLFVSASRHGVRADQPLLGGTPGAEDSDFDGMRRITMQSLLAGGVAVANLTLGYGIYLDPSLGVGLGYQHNAYDTEGRSEDLGMKWRFSLRLGHFNRYFDFGAMVQTDRTDWYLNDDERIGLESFLARLYLDVFF
jgi:hypothetical protein